MLGYLFRSVCNVPIRLLVKSKCIPDDPVVSAKIDISKPIVYAFCSRSLTEKIALHNLVTRLGLPSPFLPFNIGGVKIPRMVYIYHTPLIFSHRPRHRRHKTGWKTFRQWMELAEKTGTDIQIIPVIMFWNRDPGYTGSFSQTGSPFVVMSMLRRFFAVLFQGRDSQIWLNSCFSLRKLTSRCAGMEEEQMSFLIERMLKFYFFRTERAARGPRLPNRKLLLEKLIHNENVEAMVQQRVIEKDLSPEDARKEAYAIADEMAADFSFWLIRFLNKTFGVILKMLYRQVNISGTETVRSLIKQGHEIIYIPCHRSHMDYLLLCSVFYQEGLMPPHVASGINLNFFPMGPIIRRCGAFFLRRSFHGDEFYTTIFREYVNLLCTNYYPMEFFIEGTRSRSGRLLPPKTGLLSMIVENQLRNPSRPITVIPVYLSYEHVMEIGSYVRELSGARKQAENVWQILSIPGKLRNYGQGYVNFGRPIEIHCMLDTLSPGWKTAAAEGRTKPDWLRKSVDTMGLAVMFGLADSAVVNGLTMSALVLLSSPKFTVTRSDTERDLTKLAKLLRLTTTSRFIRFPFDEGDTLMRQALELHEFKPVSSPSGECFDLDYKEYIRLTYYRNNIIHLYIIPSLIMRILTNTEKIDKSELVRCAGIVYPFLRRELFADLGTPMEAGLRRCISALIKLEIIEELNGCYQMQKKADRQFAEMLAGVSEETLLRYGILIDALSDTGPKTLESVTERCVGQAQLLTVMNGRKRAPEFFDRTVFMEALATMKDDCYITGDTNGQLEINMEKLADFADIVKPLIANARRDMWKSTFHFDSDA